MPTDRSRSRTSDGNHTTDHSSTNHEHRYTHTTISRLCGICPGQPGWAGTRRNIHPLTLIMVINHPYLLSPSTTIHGILRIQSTCSTVFFHNLSPSFLCSTSWLGTFHFILHTFLHPIVIFFSQHMPISSQLWTQITQEALQMHRDHATRHIYEISHLKRLAIGEWPSRTLKVITFAAVR